MGNAGSYEPQADVAFSYRQCVRDFRITSLEQVARVVECVNDWRELSDGRVRICKIDDVALDALSVYAFQRTSHQDAIVENGHLAAIMQSVESKSKLHDRSRGLLLVGAITAMNARAQRACQDAIARTLQQVNDIRKILKKAFKEQSVPDFESLAAALSTLCILLDSNAQNQQATRDNDKVDDLRSIPDEVDAYYEKLRETYTKKGRMSDDVPTDEQRKLQRAYHQIQCGVRMVLALLDVSDAPFLSQDAVVMLRVTQDGDMEVIERVICTPWLLSRPFDGPFGGLDHSIWLERNGATTVARVGDPYPTTRAQLLWATNCVAFGYTKFLLSKGSVPSEIERTSGHFLLSISAHHRSAAILAKYLVENGASVDHGKLSKPAAPPESTPLLVACKWRNEELVGFLIRNQADLRAKDSNGDTALTIFHTRLHQIDRSLLSEEKALQKWTYDMMYRLCGLGATWDRDFVDSKAASILQDTNKFEDARDWTRWFRVLADCVDLWIAQHKANAPLTHFNIKKDTASDQSSYDKVLREHDQRTHRLTVCMVGPSGSGKTSLLKSIWWERQALAKANESTVGIQATALSFSMASRDGPALDPEEYEVLCYDYSGQDSYQLAHAPFFSDGTPYLQCVDLQKLVKKHKEASKLSLNEKHEEMISFVTREVCSWARIILMCKPAAEFKLVFTKADMVESEDIIGALRDLRIYLDKWKDNWLKELNRVISQEILDILGKSLASLVESVPEGTSHGLVVSCATDSSAEEARQKFAAFVAQRAPLTKLLAAYFQVWEVISKMREEPIRDLVVYPAILRSVVQENTPHLSTEDYEQVLRYLEAQGLVAVYDEFVVLDPTILHKLIGEVVSHKHEYAAGEDFETLRSTGELKHSLLVTFPTWSTFIEQPKILKFFKKMLEKNGVAYPMGVSDLMVPTFWKQDSIQLQPVQLAQDAHMLRWRYEISANMSALIFKEFAVRSYSPNFKRTASSNAFTAFVDGDCTVRVIWTTTMTSSVDKVTIQVVSNDASRCQYTIRQFAIKMEKVLDGYPSLEISRSISRLDDAFISVDALVRQQSAAHTWSHSLTSPESFPDLGWFSRKVWRDPHAMAEMDGRAHMLKALQVLTNLVVTSDSKRPFPALFTIQYSNDKSDVVLHFYSDLTGECRHTGMLVPMPNWIARKFAKWLKIGVSIFSLVAPAPSQIVQAITNKATERLQARYDRAGEIQQVINTFDQGQRESNPCEPEEAKELLVALLNPDKESISSRIRRESNLIQASCLQTGQYVWVHRTELDKLGNELQECAPGPPLVQLTASQPEYELQIASAIGVQPAKFPKTYYCSWKVVEEGDPKPIEDGETEHVRSKDNGQPTWAKLFQFDRITTLHHLRKCQLHVVVQRPSRLYLLRPDYELASGFVDLSNEIPEDTSSHQLPAEIEIDVTATGKETVEKVVVTIKNVPPPPP